MNRCRTVWRDVAGYRRDSADGKIRSPQSSQMLGADPKCRLQLCACRGKKITVTQATWPRNECGPPGPAKHCSASHCKEASPGLETSVNLLDDHKARPHPPSHTKPCTEGYLLSQQQLPPLRSRPQPPSQASSTKRRYRHKHLPSAMSSIASYRMSRVCYPASLVSWRRGGSTSTVWSSATPRSRT